MFLFLALICLLLFGKNIFDPSELYFQAVRDPNPWLVSYPWRHFLRECFFSGEFPLWNPYNALGEPFLANYQSGVFSFLRYPFYFLPFSIVIVPYLLLRLVFAGFGGWLFARKIGLKSAPSFIVAVGFMLSGYLVQYLNNQHLVIDLLIPWSLLVCERVLERATLKNFLLLILVFVLIILGGQPGASICTLGFAGAYFLFRSWSKNQLKAVWIFIFGLFVAFNFCWVQLLPFLEALPHSWTYHPAGWAQAHLEIRTLASLLSPFIFGPADQLPFPIQKTFPWLGTIIFMLFCFQISRLKKSCAISCFFAIFLVLCLGIVYALPGFKLFLAFSGLNRLSWFKYLQPIITFSAVMLAGFGLENLRGTEKARLAGAWLIVILLTISGWIYALRFSQIKGWATLGVMICFIISTVGLLSFYFLKERAFVPLVFLIILEPVLGHHFTDRAWFWVNLEKADLSLFSKLSQRAGHNRLAGEPKVWIANQGLLLPFYDLAINDALIPKRYVDLIYLLNGYSHKDELYQDFFAFHSLRLKERALENPLSRILNLKYFVKKSPPENKDFIILSHSNRKNPKFTHTSLYGDPLFVLEIKDHLPRIFFPERLVWARSLEESFERILQIEDYKKEAVVESKKKPKFVSFHLSASEILELKILRQKIALTYRASSTGFAVFIEQYFPGWKAFLDGKEIRIYLTDYLLQGVFLPKGKHRLEMIYKPSGFRIGWWAFLASLLVIILLGLYQRFRRSEAKN